MNFPMLGKPRSNHGRVLLQIRGTADEAVLQYRESAVTKKML